MSRRTKTPLPTTEMLLQPAVPTTAMEEMSRNKTRQHARDLLELQVGDMVRFIPPSCDQSSRQEQIKAAVRARHASRSYVIVTEDGEGSDGTGNTYGKLQNSFGQRWLQTMQHLQWLPIWRHLQ